MVCVPVTGDIRDPQLMAYSCISQHVRKCMKEEILMCQKIFEEKNVKLKQMFFKNKMTKQDLEV